MSKQANRMLLRAVLEPRKPGAMEAISDAIAAGADPNARCPEGGNSQGHFQAGHTLLTLSISQESSRAAERLLAAGADPNLADGNGWTPWIASALADSSKRDRLQDILRQYGAKAHGDHIGELARAVYAGDAERSEELLESKSDLKLLEVFRVDLLRHQVLAEQMQMLEWLLEHDMYADSGHLSAAVRAGCLPAVQLLIAHGIPAEEKGDAKTPLMEAASRGDRGIVEALLDAGADPCRGEGGNIEWTADFFAESAGHEELAGWLRSKMAPDFLDRRQRVSDARDPRFTELYKYGVASEELTTDDIVAALAKWDDEYGITVSLESGSVRVTFASAEDLPDKLLREIIELCPDLGDDIKGVRRSLERDEAITLWWD